MNRRRQHGAALVIVLWTALLLSMALAIAIGAARIEAQITATEWRSFSARQAAQDGLDFAAYRVAAEESGQLDRLEEFEFAINDYNVAFAPAREAEMLDINLASEQTLASFFRFLGQEPEDAAALAARVADWRDEDDLSRPNGAERRDYATARNGERIGDRLFYSTDELNLVLGFPEALFECARPALTIFGDGSPPSTSLMQFLYSADLERADQAPRATLGTASRSAAAGRRYAITATTTDSDTGASHELTGVFRITGGREQPFEWIAQYQSGGSVEPAAHCSIGSSEAE